jgi:hypothetical protein
MRYKSQATPKRFMSKQLVCTHHLPLISQVHGTTAEPAVPVPKDFPLEKLTADTASVFSGRSKTRVVNDGRSGGSGGNDDGRGGSGGLGAFSTHIILYVYVGVVVLVRVQ